MGPGKCPGPSQERVVTKHPPTSGDVTLLHAHMISPHTYSAPALTPSALSPGSPVGPGNRLFQRREDPEEPHDPHTEPPSV